MGGRSQPGARGHSRRVVMLGGLVAVTALLAGMRWRALASAEDTLRVAVAEFDRMQVDVQAIRALRQAPVTASSRERTNQELLAQVEEAMAAVGVDRTNWLDSVPQPPVQLPGSDYKKLTTRLYFEHLTMRQIAALSVELKRQDPTLSASSLSVSAGPSDSPGFRMELALAYLVFSPRSSDPENHLP